MTASSAIYDLLANSMLEVKTIYECLESSRWYTRAQSAPVALSHLLHGYFSVYSSRNPIRWLSFAYSRPPTRGITIHDTRPRETFRSRSTIARQYLGPMNFRTLIDVLDFLKFSYRIRAFLQCSRY